MACVEGETSPGCLTTTRPPDPNQNAFIADMAGARSKELVGSTPTLLRAPSGMGGTLYRRVSRKRMKIEKETFRQMPAELHG